MNSFPLACTLEVNREAEETKVIYNTKSFNLTCPVHKSFFNNFSAKIPNIHNFNI